jgi:hypothetical protein
MSESVETRRLRPVYDALDAYNYKQASKLLESVAKKHGDSQIVRALRALILQSTEREQEALEMVNLLIKEDPSDEIVLNTIVLIHRNAGCPQESTCLYEKMAQSDGSKPIQEQLYFAYGREHNYQKQQMLALKLSKTFDKKYIFWAATSAYLGGLQGGAVSFNMAERFLQKVLDEKLMKTQEEGRLWLKVLTAQGKWQQLLEWIRSSTARELFPLDRDRLFFAGDYLEKVNDLPSANLIYRYLMFKDNPDEYSYIRAFFRTLSPEGRPQPLSTVGIQCLVDITQLGEEEIRESVGWAITSIPDFLRTQIARCTPGPQRGPSLSSIEYFHGVAGKETILAEGIRAYVGRFGDKPSVTEDLRPFLGSGSGLSQAVLGEAFMAGAAEGTDADGDKVHAGAMKEQDAVDRGLRRAAGLCTLQSLAGRVSLHDSGAIAAAVSLFQRSFEVGTPMEKGERGLADDALLWAVQAYYTQWYQSQRSVSQRDMSLLLKALTLVDYGLTKSPYNFQFRLLYITLLGNVQAGRVAFAHFKELDVKNVLYETISHFVLPQLMICGEWESAIGLMDHQDAYLRECERDTLDTVSKAMKNGTYSQVEGFERFLKRMATSHAQAYSRCMRLFAQHKMALSEAFSSPVEHTALLRRVPHTWTALERDLSINEDRGVLLDYRESNIAAAAPFGRPFEEMGRDMVLRSAVLHQLRLLRAVTQGSANEEMAEKEEEEEGEESFRNVIMGCRKKSLEVLIPFFDLAHSLPGIDTTQSTAQLSQVKEAATAFQLALQEGIAVLAGEESCFEDVFEWYNVVAPTLGLLLPSWDESIGWRKKSRKKDPEARHILQQVMRDVVAAIIQGLETMGGVVERGLSTEGLPLPDEEVSLPDVVDSTVDIAAIYLRLKKICEDARLSSWSSLRVTHKRMIDIVSPFVSRTSTE